MEPDADLTPAGVATIVEDFLEALGLDDVTLVGNDSGGAMCQVLVSRRPARVGRLVLTNCDTHENFPPGIFKAMPPLAKLPGGVAMLALPLPVPGDRPPAFRPFAKTEPPADLVESWATRHRRQGDLSGTSARSPRDEQALHARRGGETARLRFPLLLAWAPGESYFPIA